MLHRRVAELAVFAVNACVLCECHVAVLLLRSSVFSKHATSLCHGCELRLLWLLVEFCKRIEDTWLGRTLDRVDE